MLILIHYNEIGLKGENRWIFEERLVRNIKAALEDIGNLGECAVKRERGRIVVEITGGTEALPWYHGSASVITEELKKVFGIAYFAFAFRVPPAADIQRLAAEVYSAYKSYISSKPHKSYKTFRIETKRSDKSFPLTSQELNKGLGEFIRKKTKMKVDLGNPDLTFFLEITRGNICVYFEKIKGLSGLPTGVSGQALSLISSGIDSPVAAWYLMKRGVSVDFVHFHSWPQTNRASIENVKKIIGVLRHYQNDCRLYLAPFWDIQKDIIKKAPEDYRVIMYRYFMFQIAAAIADKTNKFCRINKIYGALATGESLGQVASQTLDNIYALHNARNAADVPRKGVKKRGVPRSILPILQPLIGMNKEEIIEKAKQIGTYEFSIKPYDDCCGFFVPKHPVTKAESGTILKIAKSVNRNRELIEQILDKIEIVNYNL